MNVKERENIKYKVDDLVSVVAHEIKNPIALIKANVEYLASFDQKHIKRLTELGIKRIESIDEVL